MFLQVLIGGLAIGGVYALLALAMIFISKTTNVLNFAQGEMAMLSTYIAYTAISRWQLPYWLAIVLAIATGIILGIMMERIVRLKPNTGIESTNVLTVLVICLGMYFIIDGVTGEIWGQTLWPYPSPFPAEPIRLLDATISPINIGILAVATILTICLFLFLNRTTVGTTFRATAYDKVTSTLMGIKVSKVKVISWAIGGALGSVAGILVAPITNLNIGFMGPILIYGFASIIIGGSSSIYGAILGGLIIGVVGNFVTAYIGALYQQTLCFLLMILVLLIMPQGILGNRGAPTRP